MQIDYFLKKPNMTDRKLISLNANLMTPSLFGSSCRGVAIIDNPKEVFLENPIIDPFSESLMVNLMKKIE